MTGCRRRPNERGLDRHVVTVRVVYANVDEERMSTITKDHPGKCVFIPFGAS